jgi:hypothetical protein
MALLLSTTLFSRFALIMLNGRNAINMQCVGCEQHNRSFRTQQIPSTSFDQFDDYSGRLTVYTYPRARYSIGMILRYIAKFEF